MDGGTVTKDGKDISLLRFIQYSKTYLGIGHIVSFQNFDSPRGH